MELNLADGWIHIPLHFCISLPSYWWYIISTNTTNRLPLSYHEVNICLATRFADTSTPSPLKNTISFTLVYKIGFLLRRPMSCPSWLRFRWATYAYFCPTPLGRKKSHANILISFLWGLHKILVWHLCLWFHRFHVSKLCILIWHHFCLKILGARFRYGVTNLSLDILVYSLKMLIKFWPCPILI